MTMPEVEERLARLEAEVQELKAERGATTAKSPWWERIRGTFRNDPAYDEAMRLGSEWRHSEPSDSEVDAA